MNSTKLRLDSNGMKLDKILVEKLTKDVVTRVMNVCPLRNKPDYVIEIGFWWCFGVLVRSSSSKGRGNDENGVFGKDNKKENRICKLQ